MPDIESLEIIDAQIHEPQPAGPMTPELEQHRIVFQVEQAREAIDAIGVDKALAVTSEKFIEVAAERFPGRFPGVVTFMPLPADPVSAVERARKLPNVVAGRCLVANAATAILRPEFEQGLFDPIYATAEKVGLPMFNSTHGNCKVMGAIAERHPDLTIIVDHIGIAQHPVSPADTMSWAAFPDLLELARFPNVHVKLCGAPLLSEKPFPFDDVWPKLEQLFKAFTVDRVMWASDYTRLQMADLPRGERPRRRGISYADNLNYLLRSDRISFEDKKALFGGSVRRVLNF